MEILLVEPATLLRRTVALTVRSMGMASVTEAASYGVARELLRSRCFDAAVVASERIQAGQANEGLALIEYLRSGQVSTPAGMPIVALLDVCGSDELQVLKQCGVSRILLKPFRAHDVIMTIDMLARRAARPVPA
jgi:DNA-binding response OmpR family regulator